MARSKRDTDAKRQRALDLHLQGKTWAQVAELTGYASAASACQAAGIIIAQRSKHTVDQCREQGLARLALLDEELHARLTGTPVAVRTRVETVEHTQLDAEIESMMADLAANDAVSPASPG